MLAANISIPPETKDERLGQYARLTRLQGGLRSEVWLGHAPSGATPDEPVVIKQFVPHSAVAHVALTEELTLASRLVHPNIVRTLEAGWTFERPFLVSEYLEGLTLRALLCRATALRVRLPAAGVARMLLALVRAVSHAQGQAPSVPAAVLAARVIAADDVFVTYDGAVKVLGFKNPLSAPGRNALSGDVEPGGDIAHAAVDALLSGHLSPELRVVLGAACRASARPCDRMWHLARALERWQADVVRGDGQRELAGAMKALFPSGRLAQRARLEALLAESPSAGLGAGASSAADAYDDAPPESGFRSVTTGTRYIG